MTAILVSLTKEINSKHFVSGHQYGGCDVKCIRSIGKLSQAFYSSFSALIFVLENGRVV